MFNYFKITVNTFKETLREPVYFLMLLAAQLIIAHTPSAALYVFSEQIKLVVDTSMATVLFFGLIIAVLSASHTVTREMQNGTVLLLLSKPVTRWSFILGKITGITGAIALFALLCDISALVAVFIATDQFRMNMGMYFALVSVLAGGCLVGMAANFWRGSSFPEVATYALGCFLPLLLIYALFNRGQIAVLTIIDVTKALTLLDFSVIAMATIAVVFATRLDVVPNLCVSALVFFVGLISGYLFQGSLYQALGGGPLCAVFDLIYAALPNWQYFWLADAIALQRKIPASYIVYGALYVLLYMVICSLWAVALFQNREVAGDNRM